ncbi:rhodanese-like domain-containing protein [Pedobacter psychroterrae]|uniref:Rhodanese-like domain-containing protein n=1 Tax=Pedobacter psychroterrae TaxID=2530453 RepID=A0A4R0NL52_9SPHI|nr:rhodanese-like domain-containing protein [Pedobacter psychroterrae]TCD01532.1 rhodanese-like domain-containing protein [Pedobacter psychroterrae]
MGIFSSIFGTSDQTKLAEVINEGAFLVDVRSPGEFSSGSVKGAVNIPLDSLQQQLTKFKGKQNIVVFCRSGNRSSMAKSILSQHGYPDVVDGGTWQNVNKVLTQ